MTWNSFHHRGEILREAIAIADERRDGVLPMDHDGVRAVFSDDLDLLGAMMLKWHTRLSGNVERAMADQPLDLKAAVVDAWRLTAGQMPGVRAIMDRYGRLADDSDLQPVLDRAQEREWARLAVLAGLASAADATAARVGRRIEAEARAGEPLREPRHEAGTAMTTETTERAATGTTSPSLEAPEQQPSFVDRIKAALAA
jgi:hypothetical protein